MLELGIGADLVRGVGWTARILFFALLGLALWHGRTWRRKVAYAGLVVAVFLGPLLPGVYQTWKYKQHYAKAKGLFDERCKTAGEKINRTIPNVGGVVWLKWRPDGLNKGQFTMDDPYGKDCSMEGCIYQLLRGNSARSKNEQTKAPPVNGYKFVETIDPRDGIRYRYTGTLQNIKNVSKERFSQHVKMTGSGVEYDGSFLELHREMIDDFSASYGIAWDDVSTPEDREYWIAGGAIYLKDLKTNEIIAEHRGYLIDTGQGNTAGFRDPWGWAKHYAPQCPQRHEGTLDFAVKILQPIEREK